MTTTTSPQSPNSYGTTQAERLPDQLLPSYVNIDEKTITEQLQFIYAFAKLVNFYNENDALDGTWEPLLKNDLSFILATIATENLYQYPPQQLANQAAYKQATNDADKEELIVQLYVLCLDIAKILADVVSRLNQVVDDPLGIGAQVDEIVQSNVWEGYVNWEDCYMAMFRTYDLNPNALARMNLLTAVKANEAVLLPLVEAARYQDTDVVDIQDLYALDQQYDFLDQLYASLYRAAANIQKDMGELMEESLSTPTHQPHNTLLIGFNEILKQATNQLNTFTAQHLDYYYMEVLQQQLRPAEPDQVLLYYKLKKNVDSFLLPEGSQLVAGKDSTGQPILYQTDKDLFLNLIQLSQTKTIYNQGAAASNPGQYQLLAAPVANSLNGNGKAFTEPDASWPPFGESQTGKAPNSTNMNIADVGYAIADPNLFLGEGTRQIHFNFQADADSFSNFKALLNTYTGQWKNYGIAFAKLFANAFEISYTGAKGWVDANLSAPPTICSDDFPCMGFDGKATTTAGFRLSINLAPTDQAVVAYSEKVHGTGYTEGLPVFRFYLNQQECVEAHLKDPLPNGLDALDLYPYNLLVNLLLTGIQINVKVTGVNQVIVQNDAGMLNGKKPFNPFGLNPLQGADLYIGSAEVFRKQLTSLDMTIDWDNLPQDAKGFADYYKEYNQYDPSRPYNNAVFQVDLSLLNQQQWYPLPQSLPGPSSTGGVSFGHPQRGQDLDLWPLFDWEPEPIEPPTGYHFGTDTNMTESCAEKWLQGISADELQQLEEQIPEPFPSQRDPNGKLKTSVSFDQIDLQQANLQFSQLPVNNGDADSYQQDTNSGFLRMRLAEPAYGFGANEYKEVMNWYSQNLMTQSAKKIIELQWQAHPTGAADDTTVISQPKTPYAPKIKQLSIDYTATSEIAFSTTATNKGTFYHIHPFGQQAADILKCPIVPQYLEEGYLYLGFAQVNAPQTLSMMVQVDESTGNYNLSPPSISYAYLYNGEWTPFNANELLTDSTNGFLKPGIIEFNLVEGPTADGGLFGSVANASEIFWIRASVPQHAAAICHVIAMNTQAGSATYIVGADAATHLQAPLKAGSITKFQNPVASIEKVQQPFTSFGGRLPEDTNAFYTRVHERLRHKQRAVSMWDYERITLQEYPAVGLVKCIPHASAQLQNVALPGAVTVVVFPAQPSSNPQYQLIPHLNQNAISDITQTLQSVTNPDLELEVSNPAYEFLRVIASLNFIPGADPGYYLKQLNQALINYIAPWATQPDQYNPFESKISYALLYDFIAGQPYIDSIAKFNIQHFKHPQKPYYFQLPAEFDYFVTQYPWAILTSVTQHQLSDAAQPTPTSSDQSLGLVIAAPPTLAGVGQMGIQNTRDSNPFPEQEKKANSLIIYPAYIA